MKIPRTGPESLKKRGLLWIFTKKNLKIFLMFPWFFLALFTPHPPVFGGAECTPVSFDHLKIKVTEAAFSDCESCRQEALRGDAATEKINISLPALSCFQKAVSQPITRRHRICQEGSLPVEKRERGPCPSEDYVAQTAQVFYDVTQCLGIQDSEYFFALINRESRFQITAQSPTGASCYGQLTGIAIADVNQRFLPHKSDNKSCSKVSDHFRPLPTRRIGRYQYRKTQEALCSAYSNPYSCLFYSALYYKKALERAEKLVHDMDMILVQVKGKKRPWVFRDQAQYDSYFANRDKSQIVRVSRLSLLQDKQLAAHTIAMSAYNGGPSVEKGFRNYIHRIKSRLWDPEHQSRMVSMLFRKKPWGIPQGDFVDSFSRSLKGQKYRSETVSYARDVFEDYKNISRGMAPACGALPARSALTPEGQYTI